MIRPKPMQKLTVFGPKTYMKDVIEELYNMNVVHIEEHTKKSEEEFFDIGSPYESNESYADILVKLRSLISNLKVSENASVSTTSLDIIEKKTNKIHDESNKLLEKRDYFTQLKKIYTKKEIEKALKLLKIDDVDEVDYKKLLHYVGFMDANQEQIKEHVEKITKKHLLFTTNYEGLTLMALFADEKSKDKIIKMLNGYDFSPIDNPLVKKQFKPKSKSGVRFVKLGWQESEVEKRLKTVELEIEEVKVEHSTFLVQSEKRLTIETDKAEAPLKFATSKNTFLVKGWLPKKDVPKLERKLDKITNGKVMVKAEKPAKKDNVPIAFNHPKIVEPFEAFMDLYTLPSYKEIDPTFFMFLTFPFFFGLMLGDVVYGLITLGLFLWLKKKMPGAKNFLNAFILASISTIIFGFIFGEYMGYEEFPHELGEKLQHTTQPWILDTFNMRPIESHGESIYLFPHLFSRSHQMNDLLSISIIFGMTHLLIGYLIGFFNVYRAHGLKLAILEKGGWLLLYPMVLWLLKDFLGVIKGFVGEMITPILPPMPIMAGLAVVGFLFILKGEGAQGAVELPALVSNILSYARLMAVGLASLSLALVINNMAADMFRSGIGGIIGGIMILILGHMINIALGILSPFLHSLRLHYVEFFTKFFKGGGRKYKSFGITE